MVCRCACSPLLGTLNASKCFCAPTTRTTASKHLLKVFRPMTVVNSPNPNSDGRSRRYNPRTSCTHTYTLRTAASTARCTLSKIYRFSPEYETKKNTWTPGHKSTMHNVASFLSTFPDTYRIWNKHTDAVSHAQKIIESTCCSLSIVSNWMFLCFLFGKICFSCKNLSSQVASFTCLC